MPREWECRHCEHWRLGPLGARGVRMAAECATGRELFWMSDPATNCRDFTREPGADDELEWPHKAASGPRSDLVMRGAIHA
jgi:hypothetical protein